MTMLRALRPEKKDTTLYASLAPLGQVQGNTYAYVVDDISPQPTQGTSDLQVVGNKMTITGSMITLCFQQQAGTLSQIKVKVYLMEILGNPLNTGQLTTWGTQALNNNPIVQGANNVSIYDYFSTLNIDYRARYKLHGQRTFVLKPDNYSGQFQVNTYKWPIRWNKGRGHDCKIQYSGGIADGMIEGQLLMLLVADNGNVSTTTASTLAVPSTAVSTGCFYSVAIQHWYYDA